MQDVARAEKIAVFDICNTLYRSNTTHDFVDFYLRRKASGRALLFRLLRKRYLVPAWAGLSRILGRDLFRMLSVWMLRGAAVAAVEAEAALFVQQYLSDKAKAGTLSLMEDLRLQGYRIVLASASLECVVREISVAVHADRYFACTLGAKSGLLTGRYSLDLRSRKDRLVAREFPLAEDVVVITDNREDVALVRMSSRAWIICDRTKRTHWEQIAHPCLKFLD